MCAENQTLFGEDGHLTEESAAAYAAASSGIIQTLEAEGGAIAHHLALCTQCTRWIDRLQKFVFDLTDPATTTKRDQELLALLESQEETKH